MGNLPARMARFYAKLSAAGVAADAQDWEMVASAFKGVMDRRWRSEARYLTYLETEKLADDAVFSLEELRKQHTLSSGDLQRKFEKLLDAQAAVMTVRGTVKDDFDQSMG